MFGTTQTRHAAILDHLARLLMVASRGTADDPDAPLPSAIIEPAVILLLSTYPDCPGGSEVREAMREHSDIDTRVGEKLAVQWTGWCKLLHTAMPMGVLSIHQDAVARLRSPALVEMLRGIGTAAAGSNHG
jgi:hypothetical protein